MTAWLIQAKAQDLEPGDVFFPPDREQIDDEIPPAPRRFREFDREAEPMPFEEDPGEPFDFIDPDEFFQRQFDVRPGVLRRGTADGLYLPGDEPLEPPYLLELPFEAPSGFTGQSSVYPSEDLESSHFVPMEDRWRIGIAPWDRYGKDHPPVDDYPFVEGNILDPFNQNVLKGDYPIIGQHTFFNFTASSLSLFESRQVPTPTTPQGGPPQEFFGDPNQFFFNQNFSLSFDLVHGDAAFKPNDWRVKVAPIFNRNYVDVNEVGVLFPDTTKGTYRSLGDFALEEWFVETKLADTSPYYDFASVRAGSQPFVSDFRGFIFADTNRAVRLFGTRNANRDQYNAVFFDQQEKDTNSLLNTFDDRHQNTVILNYYRQDFLFPGYTANVSFHYNRDQATTKFDKQGFLVRPDPVGVFQPHRVDAYYLGFAGDGHVGRFNLSNAFYYVLGKDELNPLAGDSQQIRAYMGAVELSYDRDWARFRTSFFYSSGDDDISDGKAEGFDSIFDNPNFAGGQFSYWQRQQLKLFGVNLVNRMSLVPDLRSSKFQGQSNFVNPGLYLFNLGMDFDITPKLRAITNCNFLWFDETAVLEQFIFQQNVHRRIGTDLSLGIEYRPFLNNNVLIVGGVSGLIPNDGFYSLFQQFDNKQTGFFASFVSLDLTF